MNCSFGTLTLEFDERVLVPRSWTIAQSYWAADLLSHGPAGPVLELCAGVGHIGLLAVTCEPRPLVLVDLDPVACAYARENAAAAGLAATTEVRQGRVTEVVSAEERFAGVIADPPWVPSSETGRFPDDPLGAIDGGADGLDVAWSCVQVAAEHLMDDGWVLLQLGTRAQVEALEERLTRTPGLKLVVAEVREYGDRGMLVRLGQVG